MNLAACQSRKEGFPLQNLRLDTVFPRLMLLLCLAVPPLAGCSKEQPGGKEKAAVPVNVARAGQKSVPVELRAIGNVEPYATVAVKSMVTGSIGRVHFREGDEVGKGTLLFTIDPRPFQAALSQAKANLARDLAKAANAKEQARRYASLVQEGIVTREQYDQIQADADALSASAASQRAAVESARLQLDYCYIRAPMAGRTGNLAVHAGNLVKENDAPALVTINQITPLYVSFALPEKELGTVRAKMAGGLPVRAAIPDSGHPDEQGVVSFIDNLVDMTTGTIRVKGTFENARRRLWPGQFVNLTLTLDVRQNAVVVPTQAVQTGQQGEFVYLVKPDSSVEMRPVDTGAAQGGETVVEKGVAPGDTVVTDGQMRLTPGAQISVKKGKAQ